MQDRIKELAVEAGFDADDGEITAPCATITGDPMDVTEQVTKLAQAVARECAEITEGSSRDDDMPIHIRIFLNRASKAIRARFGLGE